MKLLSIFFSLFLFISLQAQQEVTAIKSDESTPTHQNIIKFGSSIRAEIYNRGYDYYDYLGYYYEDSYDYEGGYNVPVFVSFEHIWEMKNQTAMAIEPMAGVSFRENLTSFYVGTEFKYYWTNKGWWRMGISVNPAYSYGVTNTTRWVSMDNGNYQELKDMKVHYHIVSFDPGIIPFQFHIKNSPLVIESMFSLIGVNLITRTTDKFQVDEDTYQRISSFDVRPFLFKFELKLGIALP
jgi:hypothetical protein